MSSLKEETKSKIISLIREGMISSNEIAAKFGVTPQVVWGIKSHFSMGKYGDPPKEKKPILKKPSSWTYLILSSKGEVYLGATTNLRNRLRAHNCPDNKGFTKGRRWHLLAAKRFSTPKEAFNYETELKRSMFLKSEWKVGCVPRALKIVHVNKYTFDPYSWSGSVETF